MSSNPRRTPVTRRDAGALSLKTNMVLRKGATFHSPTTPTSPEVNDYKPPSLPRRSQTNLDDVIDAHRRRVALTLGDIDRTLSSAYNTSTSSFRDDSLPIPRGVLDHTLDSSIMSKDLEVERRVLRPRSRRAQGQHASDSGLGSSIVTTPEKHTGASTKTQRTVKSSAVMRSAAARTTSSAALPTLGPKAVNRIYEHTLKPLLSKLSFKVFHPLVLDCSTKIQEREIVCLRDVEKTLLLLAPVSELCNDKGVKGDTYRALCLKERTKLASLYLDFCLTTIRCVQATVEYLSDREQTRPRDVPYTGGYFIDLVDQIRQYAQQLADANKKGGETGEMDVDPTDEIKLHGGMTINGRHAELIRVKKDGTAISLATGLPVEVAEEEAKDSVRIKRSASEELADEEDIMRSMARRKKNATPEELAPKKCREPGCNKEFKRPCDLTKHEKTHSRPWKCPVPTCKYHEYGWPTEKEMDRHHNDKHSSAPPMYECLWKSKGCVYKSKRESNCKQHMEKAHQWTYVRTKTNGKKGMSASGSVTHTTPQLVNLPTPPSDHSIGIATPPDDHFGALYSNLDFTTYGDVPFDNFPQDIQLDYSPIDNPTPDSGADRNSAYQDIGNDFTFEEDIYAAPVQIPTPAHNFYQKDYPQQQFMPFTSSELVQPQQAPHLSPIGQGNAMLFTPTSMDGVDEGFDENPDFSGMGAGDFVLYPNEPVPKQMYQDSLFEPEVPSVAAGFSQPNSQDILNVIQGIDWASQGTYLQFMQHRAM
ncbi:hypothetical protein GE09DRAFT_1167993 [Coniochaeta sp. 2T2.1]|nr:hypothetical protein GE09DRAFT_1167993 [Coniochaeta sp. 2T2.1]